MNTDIATGNVLDTQRLASLKRQARAGDPAATKEIARQFESLFMQMVLKSMRDAVPREGLFDSQASRLYESLHDQQLSLSLGRGRGLGLAELIERQMSRSEAVIENLGPMPLQRPANAIRLDPEKLPLPLAPRQPAVLGVSAFATLFVAVSPAPTSGTAAHG